MNYYYVDHSQSLACISHWFSLYTAVSTASTLPITLLNSLGVCPAQQVLNAQQSCDIAIAHGNIGIVLL